MSFVTELTTVAGVVQSIMTIAQAGEEIVDFTEKAVKQVEAEAQANIVSSDSKMDVVLEYVKAFIDVIGDNWDDLVDYIKQLISDIVSTYNEIGLFTHSSTSDSDD